MEELNDIIKKCEIKTDQVIDSFLKELKKIYIGKVTPNILDGIFILYYNNMTPINQVARIIIPESNLLLIQPYDKNIIKEIEKAIINSNLEFNPSNDGEKIRISIPKPTEDKRKDMVKKAKKISENFKVQLRNIRRDSNDLAKKIKKNNISEDNLKHAQNEIQKIIDNKTKKIEDILTKKESSIMEI